MRTKTETSRQALDRIQGGFSKNDMVAIYYFSACGVPAAEITPRSNVLTFKAWKALGRRIAKGAKGLPVTTWIPKTDKEGNDDGAFPRTVRLFHASQTVVGKDEVAEGVDNPYLFHAATNDQSEGRTQFAEAAAKKAQLMADLAAEDEASELESEAVEEAEEVCEPVAYVDAVEEFEPVAAGCLF